MVWTEPKAPTGLPAYNDTTLKLINDLDLRLLQGNLVSVYPYVLNPLAPAQAASRADNFRDNVEQLNQTGLSPGVYTLSISHKNSLLGGTQNFSLFSNQLIEPLQGASQLQLTNSNATQMQLRWKKGSGYKRLVIASTMPLNQVYPLDGQAYSASSIWMQGDSLAPGIYCVYNDTGSLLTLSNLNPNQTLFFRIIEYNGQGSQTIYADSAKLDGNFQTLPFKLLYFGGEQVSDNQINLTWTSVQEIGTDSFIIERASDNAPYQKVGAVKAGKYSLSLRKYYFEDTLGVRLIKEFANYRLAQQNADGSKFYSKEIKIAFAIPWVLDLLYPNPFLNTIKIENLHNSKILEIQIFDLTGKEIIHFEVEGLKTKEIDLSSIEAGVYLISANGAKPEKIFKR